MRAQRGSFWFPFNPCRGGAHIHGSAGRYYPCKICFDWRNFIYESYRHRPADRRSGPRGHPQGDTKDHAYPRGRPVADSIDTVGEVLFCDGRFSQTERVELVHNDESGSDDRRYPRGMNHGNESPGSIALQWIRAVSSVSMRSVRATHVVVFYTKCFGTLDAEFVILAFSVSRMRSAIF